VGGAGGASETRPRGASSKQHPSGGERHAKGTPPGDADVARETAPLRRASEPQGQTGSLHEYLRVRLKSSRVRLPSPYWEQLGATCRPRLEDRRMPVSRGKGQCQKLAKTGPVVPSD